MISKIRDTLIGLWPVIKTYVPRRGMVLAVVIAFLLGLAWSYLIDPVVFHDSDPRTLGQSWQDEWVRLIYDRYRFGTDNAVPSEEFRQSTITLLRGVDDPQGIVARLGLNEIAELAAQAQVSAPQAPLEPGILSSIRPFILGPIILAVAFILGSLLFGFYINPILIEPIRKRLRGSQGTDAAGAAAIHGIQEARALRDQLTKEAATAPGGDLGPPVVRHVSIYMPGRVYDDSFSIEDAKKNDEFLGECGAVISETIGAGQPEKVAAVEVWLFDKEDFVRTLTAIFVSEATYNDPASRARLEPKGELVLAQPNAVARLETNTLRLHARIVDMAYGTGPLPPNSYFDRLTIELQAWRRQPGSAPAAPVLAAMPVSAPAQATPAYASPPPMPSQAAVTSPFAPPPARPVQPAAGGPIYGGPMTPLKSPPAVAPPPAPRKIEEDPFGGTGDFTPLS